MCDRCGKTDVKVYKSEDGYRLCDKCDWDEYLADEEERRNDPENHCLSCREYSEILEGGQCPMCFEAMGYTGYRLMYP